LVILSGQHQAPRLAYLPSPSGLVWILIRVF
jgi:hypothetical protein